MTMPCLRMMRTRTKGKRTEALPEASKGPGVEGPVKNRCGGSTSTWIRSGKLGAVNTAPNRCGKPRFVILLEHLAAFERANRVSPPPKPAPRRQRQKGIIDYL